jgi:hypothetical protein
LEQKQLLKSDYEIFNCHSKTTYTAIQCYFHLPDQHPRVITAFKKKSQLHIQLLIYKAKGNL